MKKLRCAIYTRKSTEEGLDMEFNTLDAQRESCEAYIQSQAHEGWQIIETKYDDGGFSGGNMKRPALEQLLSDIKDGKIDIVVVYKVDRLSRALNDFAKMVDVFDQHETSFISITQHFNTTTSMGRLTLNMLLSFAQFEREVISERIRDKFAASKKKGMWMGGCMPLGYDVKDRKLIINKKEVELVKHIYNLYLKHKSVDIVVNILNEEGHHNKKWITQSGKRVGGSPFTCNGLYNLLKNYTYIGKVKHKEEIYEGQHDAIIADEIWDKTQELFTKQRVKRKATQNSKHCNLLMGKCYDLNNSLYTTSFAIKNGKTHYRYYLNKKTNHYINASELEGVVFSTIKYASVNIEHWQFYLNSQHNKLSQEEFLHQTKQLWSSWDNLPESKKQELAKQIIERIIIAPESVIIKICYDGLSKVIMGHTTSQEILEIKEPSIRPEIKSHENHLEITIAIMFKRFGKQQKAFDKDGKIITDFNKSSHNQTILRALGNAHKWEDMIKNSLSISEIAEKENSDRKYVALIMRLTTLAPDIVDTITEGKPSKLHLKDLLHTLPIDWEEQRQLFGHHTQ